MRCSFTALKLPLTLSFAMSFLASRAVRERETHPTTVHVAVSPASVPDAAGVLPTVPPEMRRISGGVFQPFYRPADGTTTVRVQPFFLDVHPVTNGEFLEFVRTHSRWQRGQVPELMADSGYLSRWAGPLDPGARAGARQPVVAVSWFAASAFCRDHHKRLPTEYEWEFTARAGTGNADDSRDPAFIRTILAFYAQPQPDIFRDVMTRPANVWGIYDLHGLVWEWVQDFNPPTVSADSRQSGDSETSRFCGGAALTSANQADYAAFMRHAMRYSLRGTYAVANLGFRCAISQENGQ